ncbi:MAG: hypothetical protein IPK17_13225 [Chloroflexi bacterium]|uniref:hypothetical protein n=1 Tax=Candidatus Flexifilum breve TaxID=3140694 RepID=UPI00313475EF|nr:hypothetical protein [Chloroflexota bacterium]
MNAHIIAVDTYGAQRVTAPQTGKLVSAYKMGYTTAVTAVLLTLYRENARDVSPRQASYRYVQIDGDVVVRHGHILLTLTADELAKVEQITRQSHRAGVFLWRDKKWWAFPDNSHPDYTEPGYRVGPTFDPTGFRPPSPSTGERETTVTGIIAEKSQRTASEKPWWWLSGETYPHRELLKRHGARFSSRRKQWYWIGTELPTAIQALVTSETQSETEASEEEPESPLLSIFGGRIIGKERAANGDVIVKGENGVFATRTTMDNRFGETKALWVFDLPPQSRVGNPLPAILTALQHNRAIYAIYNQQWRFEEPERVAAMNALVESIPFTDDEPCTVDEAAALLGMQIKSAPIVEPPPRLFALHDTAYARHELETADGKPIPTGTRGKVVKLYHHNAKHGWSYDVVFEQIGICWSFERELTLHKPIPGIKIVRGTVVPPGAVLPPTDAEIKRTMLEYGQQPPAEEISTDVEPAREPISTPEEVQPLAIRVLKPALMPAEGEPLDAVQTAIRAIKTQPFASVQREPAVHGRAVRIEQTFVGELTGSITGNVWCYGYAVHEGVCIYLNMGGPRMAVEAIRAKLSKGDQVTVVPWDAPSVELTAGEGNSGMYQDFFANIPEARFTSLILLHEMVIHPNYGGKSTTFVLYVSEAQAVGQLHRHVAQLVKIPVFEAWASYLWSAGQAAMLVRKTRGAGGLTVYGIDLDIDSWTRLITGGIEQTIIALP